MHRFPIYALPMSWSNDGNLRRFSIRSKRLVPSCNHAGFPFTFSGPAVDLCAGYHPADGTRPDAPDLPLPASNNMSDASEGKNIYV